MRSLVKEFVKRIVRQPSAVLHGAAAGIRNRFRSVEQLAESVGPLYVFVRSYNRPLYLWSFLDSLYRYTNFPCRFIFIDNASTDPMVRDVAAGFERRQLFHAVHFMERNHPSNQNMVFFKHRPQMGKYFLLLDADIIVEPTTPCWVTRLVKIAERRRDLGVLGSYIDTEDFVDPDQARAALPQMPQQELDDLIKAHSPERGIPRSSREVILPFWPPGRLLLLRTAAIDQVGLPIGNTRICKAVGQAGFGAGIATSVRHRHLSLMNFYDYPQYDYSQLNQYLRAG